LVLGIVEELPARGASVIIGDAVGVFQRLLCGVFVFEGIIRAEGADGSREVRDMVPREKRLGILRARQQVLN
jgi:hypothetical protein